MQISPSTNRNIDSVDYFLFLFCLFCFIMIECGTHFISSGRELTESPHLRRRLRIRRFPPLPPPLAASALRHRLPRHHPLSRQPRGGFKLDLHLIINNLESSSECFQIGIETAAQIVTHVGAWNLWLAGHSLGSSMALVVGREMVKQFGIHLETRDLPLQFAVRFSPNRTAAERQDQARG